MLRVAVSHFLADFFAYLFQSYHNALRGIYAICSGPLVTPAGCCVSRCHYRPIVLCRPLVLSLHLLVVACCTPLSPLFFALPTCLLVVLASCCLSHCLCCPIMLRRLRVLSSCMRGPLALSWRLLVVVCHDASVTLSSWATLPCLGRPILLCCTLALSSPLSPYYVAPHSYLSSHWWLLHVYLVHGLLLGGGGYEWMTESCLSPFTCVRMSTASAQTMATMMRCLISCNSLV